MNDLPIPPSFWTRIVAFIVPGRHGRIEIDIVDGRVVNMRLVESVKPTKEDRESGSVAA